MHSTRPKSTGRFPRGHRGAPRSREAGMTLVELIVATGILMILAGAALPYARATVRSNKEAELRRDLREIRTAIDRYKDAADKNQIRVSADSNGYPPDLQTLVKGVALANPGGAPIGSSSSFGSTQTPKRIRFLRRIPVDPMTGNAEWGLRSAQDDLDSTSWGGQNVFDVYSRSTTTAGDGTRYSDW
ncbi:MAG TPA: type II secretion system protein [Candidatus Acidoferrales bacterium]|nr:type II secretion system protein [Candidatus Acidoferrales bacterium]